MNVGKLRVNQFKRFKLVNFPDDLIFNFPSTDSDVEVLIYYIDTLKDVFNFAETCKLLNLPKENRAIMVYRRGRKDGVNRDTILLPFRNLLFTGFKLRAPMLCSLSDKMSAVVMSYSTLPV